MQEAPQLDLDAHRDAGDLVATTLTVFARHALLFLSVTLLIVAPLVVLVTGVWAGGFADGGGGHVATAPAIASSAAPRFPLAIAAVVVYTLLAFGGLFLLIVPGIWVFVAGYFATQVAVMERRGPLAAFRRSSELVGGRWWRTAGTLLLGWVLLSIASYPAGRAIDAIDSGVIYIALYTLLLQVLTLSLSALFGTLLYFSLRAQKEHPFRSAPAVTYLPPISPTPAAEPPADL